MTGLTRVTPGLFLLGSTVLALAVSCAPNIRPTLDRPFTAEEMQQLWVQPEDITARDRTRRVHRRTPS